MHALGLEGFAETSTAGEGVKGDTDGGSVSCEMVRRLKEKWGIYVFDRRRIWLILDDVLRVAQAVWCDGSMTANRTHEPSRKGNGQLGSEDDASIRASINTGLRDTAGRDPTDAK